MLAFAFAGSCLFPRTSLTRNGHKARKCGYLSPNGLPPTQYPRRHIVFGVVQEHIDTASVEVEKELGQGTYGLVYEGLLANNSVILKRSKPDELSRHYAEVECYVNRKLSQACPQFVSKYLGSYASHEDEHQIVNLVWRDEGRRTLSSFLGHEDWIDQLESFLLKTTYEDETQVQRKSRLLKVVASELMGSLSCLHSNSIVHRDIKPDNILMSEVNGRIKLIDFGCAVDLSTRYGYDPTKGPGDPRYMPPEQFLELKYGGAFDMFSAGVILMQVAFVSLQDNDALEKFRKDLDRCNNNLDRWLSLRVSAEHPLDDIQLGLEVVSENNKAAWDFLKRLLAAQPQKRLTAAAALGEHRYLRGPPAMGPFSRWWPPFH